MSQNIREFSDYAGHREMQVNVLFEKLMSYNVKSDIEFIEKCQNLLAEDEKIDFVEQTVLQGLIFGYNSYLNKYDLTTGLRVPESQDSLETIRQFIKVITGNTASLEVVEIAAHVFRDLIIEKKRVEIAAITKALELAHQPPANQDLYQVRPGLQLRAQAPDLQPSVKPQKPDEKWPVQPEVQPQQAPVAPQAPMQPAAVLPDQAVAPTSGRRRPPGA